MGYTRLRHRILRRIEAVGRLREDMVPSICSVPFRDAIQRSPYHSVGCYQDSLTRI